MLKHSICGLVLLGLAASAAPSVDLVWEPNDLIVGVPTTISIYIQANEEEFAYGGGGFGLVDFHGVPLPAATPDGGLSYDLDGPDDTPFTADDGWVWKSGLDLEQPYGHFLVSIIPPESISDFGGNSPFHVLAHHRRLAATIVLTGTSQGNFRLVPLHEHFDDHFIDVTIKDGAEPVFHVTCDGPCEAPAGACCVEFFPSSCTDGVTQSDCAPTDPNPGRRWVKGVTCDELDPPCQAACLETVGGANYTDCDEPLTSGEAGVEVTVAGPEGVFNTVTDGSSGVWSIANVPCGEYVVTPHQVFREYCHVDIGGECPPEWCDNSTVINVSPANRSENLSIQFLGWEDCIRNDMNYDETCTIVHDTDLFAQCIYEGDCVGPDGRDLTCPADCNCDELATIVFDVPCFVRDVYIKGECGSCDDDPAAESRVEDGRRSGFTIGGAVYDDASNPLFSGVQGVDVQILGAGRGVVATAATAGPSGIWRVDDLPEGDYTVVIEHRRGRVTAGRNVIPITVNGENEAANLSIAVLRASGPTRPRDARPHRRQLAGVLSTQAFGQHGEIFFVESGVDPNGFGGGPTIVDISERLGEEISFDIYVRAIGTKTPVRGVAADFPCVGQGGSGGSVGYVPGSAEIDEFLRDDYLFHLIQTTLEIDQSKCPAGNVRFALGLNTGADNDITGLGPLYVGHFNVAVSGDAAGSHTFPLADGSILLDADTGNIPVVLRELVLRASGGGGDPPTIKHGNFETTHTQPCSGYIDPRFDSTNGIDANLGLVNDATDPDTVELTIEFTEPMFSVGGGEVGPGDFEVTETGGASPPVVISVVDVFGDDTVFRLGLSRSITVQEWTTVRAIVQNGAGVAIQNDGNLGAGVLEPDRVDIGFLPGDINQTSTTTLTDIARAQQRILGTCSPENCPECSGELAGFDINRNGNLSPIDMARLQQLYHNIGASTQYWNGKSMNNSAP